METRQNESQTRRKKTSSAQSASQRRSVQSQPRSSGASAQRPAAARQPASAGQRTAAATQRAQSAAQRRSASQSNASQRSATATRRRSTAQKTRKQQSATPDVVYTPAAPFSRGQLLIRLLTVFAVVLALVFGISIFFHVETITISGAEKYEEWTIREASGLKEGDNLLSVNDAQVSGNIIAKLPYVKNVRVGIKLPNTVNIYIEEQEVVYAIRDTSNIWWLINSEGRVMEPTDLATAGEYPQILGIALYKPVAGEQAVAEEPETETPTETTEEGETIPAPVTVLGKERLNTALDIVQYLEDYKVIDKIVSVDVTEMGNIMVAYGQQYRIDLGDTIDLKMKLEMVIKGIPKVNELYDNPVGTIDASLRTERQLIFTFSSLSGE